MYKELQISSDVPAKKLKSAFNGGTLTLSKAELSGTGATLHLHPASFMKALKARKDGKGTRLQITHKEIGYPFKHAQGAGSYGGSIWGKIWKGIKSGFKFAKDAGILSPLADMAATAAIPFVGGPGNAALGRQALRGLTGIGVQGDLEGGRLSLKDVQGYARNALGYAKRRGILTDVADAGEKYLLSKASKPEHTEIITKTRKAIRANFGIGVAGTKKMAKGSQAAKDHMAKLRAMRKTKGSKSAGGSFRLD